MIVEDRRRRLWVALSELFLDTEVRWCFPWVAQQAIELEFPWSEVETILYQEVAPVVSHNLFDLAGDWTGFDPDWLSESIERRLQKPLDPLGQAHRVVIEAVLDPVVRGLERVYRSMQRLDVAEHQPILMSLARLYLDADWGSLIGFWSHLQRCARYRQTTLNLLWSECIVYGYQPLLRPDQVKTDSSPQVAQANWDWFCQFRNAIDPPIAFDWASQVCEQLAYIFTIPQLAKVSAGPIVVERLLELRADPYVCRLLIDKMSGLYVTKQRPASVQANQAYIFQQLETLSS